MAIPAWMHEIERARRADAARVKLAQTVRRDSKGAPDYTGVIILEQPDAHALTVVHRVTDTAWMTRCYVPGCTMGNRVILGHVFTSAVPFQSYSIAYAREKILPQREIENLLIYGKAVLPPQRKPWHQL